MSFAALGVGGTIAAAAALATAGTGVSRAIGSRKKARQNELEQFANQSPLYTPSKSIQDYYQQAMNRYNENPYQSQQYKMGAMNAQRATAQGIGALQDRRSAIGGISRLALGQNAAMQNLGAQAEAQRNQRFGQLGGASQMQAAEQAKAFDINKMTPYNRMLQLKQYKAQAAADENAAGWGMLGQGLGNLASVGMMAGTGAGKPATNFTAQNQATLNNFTATRGAISMPKMGDVRASQPRLWGMDEPIKRNWYSNDTM
jgi:hypothetical protein